ncbi:serine/threonine protein kinase [Nocardia yunnanensis]|uniref:non-specific serine/threonine protein kinase n=1 Tax=Nocardia yunnanensis TaxID=2382165 RepID=A0A386Z7F6_9NOCA|nr:serine/threonine-protein kinase [Nocardia yunnanensis]AYF73628.1 serine/threonine protein kinase [Nocardia yunnanensis]
MAAGARAGSRFGQYELRKLLGVGGMGEVYEAYDTVRDRVVAVKLLDVELARQPSYVERFRRESRTAAKLQEPHVIPVHDWGEVDGTLFIDMRLVRGRDLKAYLREEGPLPPERAVAVVEQIASALDAAHESGLVHRDIKPANILLTGELFAYLVDFGIAHTESDAQLTQTGNAIGSFAYMAPERFEHNVSVSPGADIYALACVLYEALTGLPPFLVEGNLATIRAHMLTPPPRPSVRSGVPVGLDQVVAVGMAKEPGRRYASAGQLARAARAALQRAAQEPARTIPPAPPTLPSPAVPPNHSGSRYLDLDHPSGPAQPYGAVPPRGTNPSGPQRLPGPRDVSGSQRIPGPAAQHSGERVTGQPAYTGPGNNDPTVLRQQYFAGQPGYADPAAPREHPSAPLPLPSKPRNNLPLILGALIGVVLVLGAVLAWALLSGPSGGGKDSGPGTTTGTTTGAASAGAATATSAHPYTGAPTTTLAPFTGAVSGTDAQGFTGQLPRCNADDPAMAVGRTDKSRLVVCRTAAGRFYYKGLRISDNAGIQLDDPVPDGTGGYTVTNPTDGTEYRITAYSLVITNGGQVAANESMIEYAHR